MIPPCRQAEDDDKSRLIDLRRCMWQIVRSYKEEEEICALLSDHMRPAAEEADEEDYGEDGLMIEQLVSWGLGPSRDPCVECHAVHGCSLAVEDRGPWYVIYYLPLTMVWCGPGWEGLDDCYLWYMHLMIVWLDTWCVISWLYLPLTMVVCAAWLFVPADCTYPVIWCFICADSPCGLMDTYNWLPCAFPRITVVGFILTAELEL